MTPSHLQEFRAAWMALALLLCAALPWFGPVPLGLAFLPWLAGAAMLFHYRSAEAAAAAAARLGLAGGRMTLLVAAVLLGLMALVLNPFWALVLLTWAVAAGLAARLIFGAREQWPVWERVVMVSAALAVAAAMLEGVCRLPWIVRRFGSPAEALAWEGRYDPVADRNVFGFRSVHQVVLRTPGVGRILTLGDSFTWGDKVASTDSIWPSRLEAELQALTGRPSEVVNISRRGWSTADEVSILDRLGWQFRPDWLLIQFYANDAQPSEHEPGVPVLAHRRPPPPVDLGMLRSSALVWVVRAGYAATLGQAAQRGDLIGSYDDASPGWRTVQAGLRRVADSARAHGARVTLVLFPSFTPGEWTASTHPLGPLYRKVAQTAEGEGLEVLDLIPAFAKEGGDWRRWWATSYDRHPSAAAHAIVAHTVAEYLVQRGWKAGPSSPGTELPAPGR